jgi:hypothetical protein
MEQYRKYQSITITSTTAVLTYDNSNKRLQFDSKKTYRVACEGYAINYVLLNAPQYTNSGRGTSVLTMDTPQDAYGNVAENPNSIIKTTTIIGNTSKHSGNLIGSVVYASDCSGDNAGLEISGALLATTPEFIFRARRQSTLGTLPVMASSLISSITANIGFYELSE